MYVVWSLLVGLESLGRACHVRSLVVRDAFLDGADFVSELFDDWFVGWVVFLQQISVIWHQLLVNFDIFVVDVHAFFEP